MKKLIYLFGIIFIFSCEKDELCMDCTTIKKQWLHKPVITNFIMCGEKNIDDTIGILVLDIDGDYTTIETKCK